LNYTLKKKGKYWHYYFRVNQKRYRGSTRTQTKEFATDYVNNLYKQLYYHKNKITPARTRIDEFIQEHLLVSQTDTSKDWHYTKSCLLKLFLDYVSELGLTYLDEVELSHLEQYKSRLMKSGKPKTAKNHLSIISSMFSHAIELGYIHKNPARNKKLMRFSQIQKNKVRFLSKDEIKLILNAVKDTFLYELVLCGIYTGMRRGELVNLEYEDVDYKRRLIYVRNKEGFQTKSRKERVLPMHKKLFKLFNNKKKGYCFTRNHDAGLNKDVVTRTFTDIVHKLELNDVTLHTLRHSFISHSLMSGVSIWEVAQWVGHSTTHMTELYGHLCTDRREIDKLNF
jgi:integrase